MPDYGDSKYWDKRYLEDAGSPFDWLFSFDDVKDILHYLLPNKDEKILLVGSGNAPFSPELYSNGKYSNLINIDLSPVVTEQQSALYPEQQWLVMDVLDMSFDDASFPVVIDKSLIDTLLCYSSGSTKTNEMLKEIERILKPGSRFISFSLHSLEEASAIYRKDCFKWTVSLFRVKSSRWNETNNRKRAIAHTLIVCDMPTVDGQIERPDPFELMKFPFVLTDQEYFGLNYYAKQVCLRRALAYAKMDELMYILYTCLGGNGESLTESSNDHDGLNEIRESNSSSNDESKIPVGETPTKNSINEVLLDSSEATDEQHGRVSTTESGDGLKQ